MTDTFQIEPAAAQTIRRAAAAAPNVEICGLLIGSDGPASAVLMPNRHPDPARGFAICDAAHARVQRIARRRGERVLGCFHSHPSGDTAPSDTDLLAANEDGFIWVICAPDGRLQAWRTRIRRGVKSMEPLKLETIASAHSAIAAAAAAI